MVYSAADVIKIAATIEQDAAGIKQATMTDLDFAAKMLRALIAERDQLSLHFKRQNEWAKGEHARICAAENRQLIAEQQRDVLLTALESMMKDIESHDRHNKTN